MNALKWNDWVSIAALAISLGGAALNFRNYFHDRARLKTKYSTIGIKDNFSIRLEAVNVGRRPIILTMLWRNYENGQTSGEYLDAAHAGIRLGENERFIREFDRFDHIALGDEGAGLVKVWFEDTLGRQYRIKLTKSALKQLYGSSN